MSSEAAPSRKQSSPGVRSQTLERALDALQLLADERPRTSAQLAVDLGLHRSIVYRILRTLEDYSLVSRLSDGRYQLGLGMAALAESAVGRFQAQVGEVLQELANVTGSSAIFCAPQGGDAVVLSVARPLHTPASVAIRPGARTPLGAGAPGLALLSLEPPLEYEQDEVALARSTGFVHTKGAPFTGLDVVAVPLRLTDGQSASLCVVYPTGDADAARLRREVGSYALRLSRPGDSWGT